MAPRKIAVGNVEAGPRDEGLYGPPEDMGAINRAPTVMILQCSDATAY